MATTRTTKTFSIEKEVLKEVVKTKGSCSTSERVNELLKAGLEAERKQSLHSEAAAFFRSEEDRGEARAFQTASLRSITRE